MSTRAHLVWRGVEKRAPSTYLNLEGRFSARRWQFTKNPGLYVRQERSFTGEIRNSRVNGGYAQLKKSDSRPSRKNKARPPVQRIAVATRPEVLGRNCELVYLRDCCDCDRCVDSSTSQKLFETAEIPPNISSDAIQYQDDGGIQITWKNDIPGYEQHVSSFSPTMLRKAQMIGNELLPQRKCWGRAELSENIPSFTYSQFLSSSETLRDALIQLQRYGLVFLQSIPSEPSAIEKIAAQIGPLRNTFYGPTWDVKSVPSAKNVAYTSQHLGFHMDLLYMADPPGLQILHTMKACAHGGESLFSDGLRVVHRMKVEDPEEYQVLTDHFVTYRYKNDGHWYTFSRPVIDGNFSFDSSGEEKNRPKNIAPYAESDINWSPPFQGPFKVIPIICSTYQSPSAPNGLSDYIRAAKVFKTYLESEDAVFETKMEPGTCVIFDNRRILHARKAFRNDSKRWLRGAYIDKDPFKSRLRMLLEESPIERKETAKEQ
jgi:gamma-butyrobetaine dioxygenase